MVTDTGGIDDKSFNASAVGRYAGRQGPRPATSDPKYVASTAEADYEPNLAGGFVNPEVQLHPSRSAGLMGDALKKGGERDHQLAVRDRRLGQHRRQRLPDAVSPTDQAAFLAGYLAAGLLEDRHRGDLRRP